MKTRACTPEEARRLLTDLHQAYNSLPAFKRVNMRSTLTTLSIVSDTEALIAELVATRRAEARVQS